MKLEGGSNGIIHDQGKNVLENWDLNQVLQKRIRFLSHRKNQDPVKERPKPENQITIPTFIIYKFTPYFSYKEFGEFKIIYIIYNKSLGFCILPNHHA